MSQLAQQLSCVVDLSPELFIAKCRGQLFFRGDSHLNWVGSYWCYRAVLNAIGRILPVVREPIDLAETIEVTVGYDGDLYEPLPGLLRARVDALAGEDKGPCTLELTPQLYLRRPRARRVAPPAALAKFCERPTIVTESDDRSLPRAVIIRDSTAQYMIDFLAEHFSRAVFYWHEGAVFEDVIASERPDIVLHLNGERVIFDYPYLSPTCRLTALL